MSTTNNSGRHWFKSSFSRDSSNCVEIRHDADIVLIRDSKFDGAPAEQPTIPVAAVAWDSFLEAAAAGASTVATSDSPAIEHDVTTGDTILRSVDGTVLTYTPGEWDAFIAGARDGEFNRIAVPA